MRLPVKSETDAFRIAYGCALLIGLSLAVGALLAPAAGAALFVGGLLGAVGWDLATEETERIPRLREAATVARAAAARSRPRGASSAAAVGRLRILVIANETMVGRELRGELLRRGEPRPELRVVAPVLPSRAHYVASDIDDDVRAARARLDATLAWAHEHGFDAAGRVGGDTRPMTAVEDELRRYPADELIISTHPPGRSNWLESGLVERARAELDIPVTHVIVDLQRQHVTVDAGVRVHAAR
jgi:hypothetical protein